MENFKAFIEELSNLNIKEPCFLLLDNGSDTSKMEEIAVSFCSKNKSWELIRSEKNLGFGGGVLFASKHIVEDYICWMPGNMKIKPSDVYDLITKENFRNINLLVKAKRVNRPLLDLLKTKIFGILSSFHFKKYLYDLGGTPNIISKKLLLQLSNPPKDFSFDAFIYYFAKLNNFNIQRPKISYTRRLHGVSHWQKGISSEISLTIKILKSKNHWKEIALEHKKNQKI